MTQEKMRKLITAVASAATLLLVVLFAVLIYQWITLGVLERREQKYMQENAELQQIVDEKKMDAEYWESELGQKWLAINHGYSYPNGEK